MRNFDEIIDIEAVPKALEKEVAKEVDDRIPGRVAVAAFSIILVLGFLCVLAIGLQFQTIMNRLDASRSAWPEASKELTQRFGQAEQFLVSVDAMDNSSTLMDWRFYHNQFGESRQFDRQVASAAKLEEMLEAILSQGLFPATSPIQPIKANSGLLNLLEKEQWRKNSEQGTLGRWTKTLLRLKTPPYFEPVSR
ncbi:MAG: hypothetical protein NTV29_01485 [Planctomycetota bacterium]|nr:hypothetical protein [Planctomycetota bacterium]